MFRRLFTGPVLYRDGLILLTGIPLIVVLSHYLTYNGSDSAGWFIYELISDGIKITIVWMVVRACIYLLDRRLPWQGNFVKRLGAQILLTAAAGMVTLTILQLLDFGLIRSYPLDHYGFDLVISLLFILLVNAVYIILYYQQSLQLSYKNLQDIKLRQDESRQTNTLLIKLGKKQLAIPFGKMAGFYAVNKSTLLFTTDGQSYPVDLSLDQLEKEPCSINMFRANRQWLVTTGIIRSLEAESGGKINLSVSLPQSKEPVITVSREKAAAFRTWFKAAQTPVHP